MTSTVAGKTPAQIAALSTTAVAQWQPSDIAALTTAQAAALAATQLNVLSKAGIQAFAGSQIAALSTAAIKGLSAGQIANLTTTEVGELTATQIGALTASEVAGMSTADLAAISLAAISGLSAPDISALSSVQEKALTAAQINALTAASLDALNPASLTATQVYGLSPASIGRLTEIQLGALLNVFSATETGELTSSQLNGLTSSQLGALSSAAERALTVTQIDGLDKAHLDALNASLFTPAQVAGLSATAIANLTVAQFDAGVAVDIAAVTTTAISGMTIAEYQSLTTAELAALSTAQKAALAPALAQAEIAQYSSHGSFSYSGMLALLQNMETGGMTAAKFAALQDIAGELNTPGGLTASAYVQQITGDVVDGNSANARWNGGASTAVALGNLSATSTATQVGELIGKWFLGTDLPSTNLSSTGESPVSASYQASTLPLYGSTGAPAAADVNQGYIGDCYFMASLAEVAQQNPSAIENMIQSNGNGTYSVDFKINGADDYVTVNSQLSVMTNAGWANGSKLEFANGSTLWAPLIEKAYAELNEQTGVPHGGNGGADDSYAGINGGSGYALGELTGQSVTDYSLGGMSSTALNSLESMLGSEFAAHAEVLLSTPDATQGNLIGDHMFEVSGINAAKGTITLQNPWNTAVGSSASLAMSFTESISALAADNCWLYASSPSTSHAA